MSGKTPQEMQKEMADFLNTFNDSKLEQFVKEMAKEHRTLQQSFTKLCMMWIKALAGTNDYDGRNEDSVLLARKIIECLSESDMHLPMI